MSKTEVNKTGILGINGVKIGLDSGGNLAIFWFDAFCCRYDSTTATGETFNKGGKTDILLKYAKDGSNLFVAECKFWHGSSEFQKAISQLFDRYLTWRDSKAALILFVTNKDFTNIIETIKNEVKRHPYYLKLVGNRGETSLSYHFHLPQDRDK